MEEIIVQQGQNLADVSIGNTGTLENLMAVAQLNGNISITDNVAAGSSLQVDNSLDVVNKKNLDYYYKNNIRPGTEGVLTTEVGGIGFMSVGGTFKVG